MTDFTFEISITPKFLPEHSDVAEQRWVFSYTIRITNQGSTSAQLISRYWLIEDAKGQREEVRGLGVVGHQPLIEPGQSFEYTSGCPLATPYGTMQGHYFFVGSAGERFEVPVPVFVLDAEAEGRGQGSTNDAANHVPTTPNRVLH